MDLREAEQLECVKEDRATMGKRYRCMVVEAAQERVPIESTESGQVRSARTTEGFRIEVKKMSLRDVGLQAIADPMHLDDRNR